MKNIGLVLVVSIVLFFFFVPVRKIKTGCSLFGGSPEKTEILTTYQAFKQGYLQIPNSDNYWTFKTEPPTSCV